MLNTLQTAARSSGGLSPWLAATKKGEGKGAALVVADSKRLLSASWGWLPHGLIASSDLSPSRWQGRGAIRLTREGPQKQYREVTMICDKWTEFIKQILNHAGHGYEFYCPVVIPAKKAGRVEKIDVKISNKYNIDVTKDVRYRRKKKGLANYVYLRCGLQAVILKSKGQEAEIQDRDKFLALKEKPYEIKIGEWISIKLGPARMGKKYTVYLTKSTYRSIKAMLQENIEHRRFDALDKYYLRLQELPAYSGILAQTGELCRFCRSELSRHKLKHKLQRLVLKPVYNPS